MKYHLICNESAYKNSLWVILHIGVYNIYLKVCFKFQIFMVYIIFIAPYLLAF